LEFILVSTQFQNQNLVEKDVEGKMYN